MKYTNKDAKLRMYDGSEGSGTIYTVTAVGIETIEASAATWTINEFKHGKVFMIDGTAAGKVWEIWSNTTDTLTVNASPVIEDVQIGDTFKINEPWYLEMCLDSGDFTGPMGAPKHEEILVLDRGLVTPCAHYISSNDAPVMEPVDISFSVMINDSQKFLDTLDWIEGLDVNGHTTTTTKGHSERIVVAGDDLNFFDPTKKCSDIEYKLTGTTNNITYIFREVYFDLAGQTFAEAEDGVTLSLTGKCYGRILRKIDFTTGDDILA